MRNRAFKVLAFAASVMLMAGCRHGRRPGPPPTLTPRLETTQVVAVTVPAPSATTTFTAPTPEPTAAVYLPWLVQPGQGKIDLPGLTPTETAPPPPTPTPTPAWPPPLVGQTASKLGLHVIQNNDPYVMEFVRRTHPRVMKSVDDLGWLTDVKAASPATITIGRLDEQNEDWVGVLDPQEAARQYIASQLERYRLNPGVDYWEGWNEFVPVNAARMSWYATFEAARACQMRDLGLRAAVGGFSVGVPEYAEMGLFLPALEAAHRCGGLFTLHEYNSPTMACGVSNGVTGIIPGAPGLNVPAGYHTLRYRFWYEGYLKPRGLGDLPLVISEIGIAAGPEGGACDDPGSPYSWKGYQDWWVQQGLGPDGPQAYVNTLAWYDAELRKDPYVIGATIFTAGAADPANGWNSFDVHDLLIPLAYYAVEQQ